MRTNHKIIWGYSITVREEGTITSRMRRAKITDKLVESDVYCKLIKLSYLSLISRSVTLILLGWNNFLYSIEHDDGLATGPWHLKHCLLLRSYYTLQLNSDRAC